MQDVYRAVLLGLTPVGGRREEDGQREKLQCGAASTQSSPDLGELLPVTPSWTEGARPLHAHHQSLDGSCPGRGSTAGKAALSSQGLSLLIGEGHLLAGSSIQGKTLHCCKGTRVVEGPWSNTDLNFTGPLGCRLLLIVNPAVLPNPRLVESLDA